MQNSENGGLSTRADSDISGDADLRKSRGSESEFEDGSTLKVPNHVAIIMDGNARWAQERGLKVAKGHRSGYSNIQRVVSILRDLGVCEVTLFAFSTENWQRPDDEVEHIMELASEAVVNDVWKFHENGVRLRHVGSAARIGDELREMIEQAVETTAENDGFVLNLAFDYGGREDILHAVGRMIDEGVTLEEIDEDLFSSYLYTAGCSEPDLIIRTGGEFRISNFMLWQSAYSEFHSTQTLWPDFGASDIEDAFVRYGSRHRRYGRRPA